MRFDLAIIGGGPAGAAVAIRAAQHGLSAAVVNPARTPDLRVGETVPPDVERPLRQLGVWDAFLADDHARAAGACSAWGEPALAWSDGFTSAYGGGWHLHRPRFDATLRGAARAAGAAMLDGWVSGGERSADEWHLELAGRSQRVRARFLVDATGRTAGLARRLGAHRLKADRLIAVHAALELGALSAMQHTVLEAVEHGWWYAARIPGDRVVVSLFTDAAVARTIGALQPAGWHWLLAATRHVSPLLGAPAAPSRVRSISAASHCLDRLHGPGWLAVGDAACALDPLASAGIFLALQDGMSAGDAIARALLGDTGALGSYSYAIRHRFTRFLFERRARYALETRWPGSEFWRRRAQPRARAAGVASAIAR